MNSVILTGSTDTNFHCCCNCVCPVTITASFIIIIFATRGKKQNNLNKPEKNYKKIEWCGYIIQSITEFDTENSWIVSWFKLFKSHLLKELSELFSLTGKVNSIRQWTSRIEECLEDTLISNSVHCKPCIITWILKEN